jgi:hypothetical protein
MSTDVLGPLACGLWVVYAVRLSVAYRKYLRFDHPRLTVALTQLAQILLLGALLSQIPLFDVMFGRWLSDVYRSVPHVF